MDPILLDAIRQMLVVQDRARQAGVPLEPSALDNLIRTKTGGKYSLADAQKTIAGFDTGVNVPNVIRSINQGATFGFVDELSGLLQGKGEEARIRLANDLFKRAHPGFDIGANVAGALAVPGPGAIRFLKEAKGAGTAAKVATGALTGATAGGLAGAGTADDGDRIAAAKRGALVGGVLGGTASGLASTIASAASPMIRAERRVAHAIAKSGGVQALLTRVSDAANLGKGGAIMLADLSGPLRKAADFAANNSEDVFDAMQSKVANRQADQAQRVLADVRAPLGNIDPGRRAAALANAKQAIGDRAYDALRSEGTQLPGGVNPATQPVTKTAARYVVTPPGATVVANDAAGASLADIINTQPKVAAAWKEAQQLGMVGAAPDEGAPSFEKLHYIMQRLRGASARAWRSGDGDLGRRLGEASDLVEAELQTRVPGYGPVASEYARRSALERALQSGVEAWDVADVAALRRTVQRLSPAELREFRRGMAGGLVKKLQNAATNRDVATQLVQGGETASEKLKVAFGSKENFDRFMAQAKWEAEMARLRGAVGGSATHRRDAAAVFTPGDAENAAIAGVREAVGGPVAAATAATRAVVGGATHILAGKTANRMGPILMTEGAPAIDALLRKWAGTEASLSPWWSRGLPAAGGAVFGRQY